MNRCERIFDVKMKLEKQADLKRRRRSNASEVKYVLNYKIVLKSISLLVNL